MQHEQEPRPKPDQQRHARLIMEMSSDVDSSPCEVCLTGQNGKIHTFSARNLPAMPRQHMRQFLSSTCMAIY